MRAETRQRTVLAQLLVMRSMFALISLSLLLSAQVAEAQTYNANASQGNGIVNASGQFAQQIGGVGAQANRNAANQLFQQALQHEQAGLASMNVGMLSQAFTESQQGIKADDQSRALAQTALTALKSGNTAGHVDLTQYGVTEDQMRDLANNSSPLLPEVQSQLSSFGISVDHNAAVAQTPFGSFPLDAGPGDVTSALSSAVQKLGLGSSDVAAGVQAGMANANAIGNKALADAQAAVGGARAVAATNPAAGAPTNNTDADNSAAKKAAEPSTTLAAKEKPATTAGLSPDEDMKARLATFKNNRAKILKQYSPNSYADSSTNLFLLVHDRYMEMDRQGSFIHDQKIASYPVHP